MSKHILILPGDGIGPEVTSEVVKLIDWLNAERGAGLSYAHGLIGGVAYDSEGTPLPAKTTAAAKAADAVLLGAVGGPQYDVLPFEVRPERGLLGIRKELGLYANLRPAICFDALADASSLKREIVAGLDILIVRELTGDLYFGEPRGVQLLNDGTRRGYNTMVYTTPEIERIARTAFELARKRDGRVCSVDKANVLECTGLWREVVQELRDSEYTDIELSHMYVDNAAMQLVRTPKQFDVMVTGNMFGDILSDAAAMLTGSLGMLPSASLGETTAEGKTPGLYEPVHGSAPDIAGQNIANPLATILSFAMMLRYSLDMAAEADQVEDAVQQVLAEGIRTADIMAEGSRRVGTTEMGDAVLAKLAVAARSNAA